MEAHQNDSINGKEVAKSKAEIRQQKLSEIRRRQRTKWVYVLIAVIGVAAAFYELYHSSYLDIKSIEISGNNYVKAETIKSKCDLSKPTNILRVPVNDIRQKLANDPWIKSVDVVKIYPSTLRIEIEERRPVALISLANSFYFVDKEYFIIASREFSEGLNLPVITDLPVSKIKTGDRLINPSLKNAIDCLAAMEPTLGKSINLMSALSVNKLSLYNKDDIEILYGDARFAGEKNKVISGILKEHGKQVITIDIRSYPQTDPVISRLETTP
ncbi:MAG: FtsQ-type POTRA domain-containing protein [Rubrobacteridae bacterium]|nr:FtsQ-type POTRA domain-containing protein [Rubrobacteridae bacterium]